MPKVIVAGTGTDVGKTVVSAILTVLMKGDYWKPIQCGDKKNSDTAIIEKLIDTTKHHIYSPAYSFNAPVSPHHAARLEGISIHMPSIVLPQTKRPLIIESVGGVFVPLTTRVLTVDLFKSWNCQWVIVSKHYLGSINHTLLTLEILKRLQVPIAGIIFNGEPNPDSEAAILEISSLPLLGRFLPEAKISPQIIQKYVKQWQPQISQWFR